MTTKNRRHRDELGELLPWYANGTLEVADRKRIEKALKSDPALRKQLELVLEDRQAAIELAEKIPLPASLESRFNAALNNEIERHVRQGASAANGSAATSWLARLATFMTPPRLAFAGAAAAAVIALQAAALLTIAGGPGSDGSTYQTATGGNQQDAEGIEFLVSLAPNSTVADLTVFLSDNRGQIVGGPGQSGLFRLRFANEENQDTLMNELERRQDLFAIVLPGGK